MFYHWFELGKTAVSITVCWRSGLRGVRTFMIRVFRGRPENGSFTWDAVWQIGGSR